MTAAAATRTVAILVFEDVEVLDFCGPFEVFSVSGREQETRPFRVCLVAERSDPIRARNGLRVLPDYTTEACPAVDLLVVPGGQGTRREMHNAALCDWIRRQAAACEMVLSVCTGALLLARAGLLAGLTATTHHGAIDLLREVATQTTIDPARRVVDNGRIITAAGVAAGIDASLYVVARLLGQAEAERTARHIEYPWPRPGWEATG